MKIYLLLAVLQQITAYSVDVFTPQIIMAGYFNSQIQHKYITLQQFEKITFVNSGGNGAKLNSCCDTVTVHVNDQLVASLANSPAGPGETWWEYTANSEGVRIRFSFRFNSNSDPGLKGTYNITCDKPCNFGTCVVNRYSQEDISDPVTCKCIENYSGEDCSVDTAAKAANGVLLPYVPRGISHWHLHLHPNELVTFNFHDLTTTTCLIKVDNETILNAGGAKNSPITVTSNVSGKNVSIMLDTTQTRDDRYNYGHRTVRENPRISYNISCTPEYCKGAGECHTNRTNTTSNPPFCKCDAHYKGPRCEQTVHDCPLDCSENSECVWTGERYTCKCLFLGFVQNGTECIDINECESPENPCSPTEICVNTLGSFKCKCPPDNQALQTSAGIDCVFSGCAFPWNESRDRKCYLTEGFRKTAKNASEYCETINAVLSETENMEQVEEIGLASKSALIWIGLTDIQRNGNWKWKNKTSTPRFSNWGPGFPTTTGDLAVLYPNRWTTQFKDCTSKKRFICETTDPFCPSEWIRIKSIPKKCFFQSKTTHSFEEAQGKCAEAAIDGRLATWKKEMSANFKPTHWDPSTDADSEGFAQFWINHLNCKGSQCSPIFATSFRPLLEARDFTAHLEFTSSLNSTNLTAVTEAPKNCAFLFPNKWADYTHEKSEFKQSRGPTVACQRRSPYMLKDSSNGKENANSYVAQRSSSTTAATSSLEESTARSKDTDYLFDSPHRRADVILK